MENRSYNYIEEYDLAALRSRQRRKRRRGGILPVFSLGIVLAFLVGIALRFGPLGQWAKATTHTPDDSVMQEEEQTTVITLPDTVEIQALSLPQGYVAFPEEFVYGLDCSDFSVQFKTEPDYNVLGSQEIALSFVTKAGTIDEITNLYIFELVEEVSVVMGSGEVADVRYFVPDLTVDASFVGLSPAQIPEQQSGVFDLTILCDGTEYPVRYVITETIPPEGVGLEVSTTAGTLPPADTLVGEIVDDSQVIVSYLTEPDVTVLGKQTVCMVLTDAYGNSSEVEAVLEVTPNPDGPQFSGLEELHIQVGSTISYKAGVSVTDAQDGELTFSVDPLNVDNKTIGTYTAAYTATDADGNTLKVYRTIVVQDEAAAAVEAYAQKALSQIITDDMTHDEKIYAIYRYTRSNVKFVGTSDKSSIVHSAYEGFSTGKGDCYTYYAMNVILLDLLGIENLEVARIGGASNHWWNLVLHEDGQYYHVDSCPKAIYLDQIQCHRMTDSDLDIYTYDEAVFAHRPNYYVYDKTLPEYQNIAIAP